MKDILTGARFAMLADYNDGGFGNALGIYSRLTGEPCLTLTTDVKLATAYLVVESDEYENECRAYCWKTNPQYAGMPDLPLVIVKDDHDIHVRLYSAFNGARRRKRLLKWE